MSKEVKEVKEQYKISRFILEQGYNADIPFEKDGENKRRFIVTRGKIELVPSPITGQEKRQMVLGSVFEDGKVTGKHFFEGLTVYQIHILAHAKVIELTKEQSENYKKEFYN